MPEGSKPDCIIAIANVIPDMGALTRLDISKNGLHAAGTKALTEGLKGNQIMMELNISSNDIGKSGAIELANAIPDMGAISSINLLRNSIPIEQAHELVKIMQAKEKLTTLCDLSGNEATLDFSNQGLGAGDAVLIANDISNMGALTSLDISTNKLTRDALKSGKSGLFDSDYEIDLWQV
jgi:hypothetical protein